MKAIEQMLTGEMEMRDFVALLQSDLKMQDFIRNLVPKEAVNNPCHEFWTYAPYKSLAQNQFDYYQLLKRISRFDGSINDALNISSSLARGYLYYHQDLHCTDKYHEAFELYLDVIRDCFEGPEVERLVEQIINDALPIRPKSKRRKEAKRKVEELFHIVDRKHWPRWIQGADWPMGVDSPMQYVSRRSIADGVDFIFTDITTGEVRIVTQYY